MKLSDGNNTCYIVSVIQSLINLKYGDYNWCSSFNKHTLVGLTAEIADIARLNIISQTANLNTFLDVFFELLQYTPGKQEDAQDALYSLINVMTREANFTAKPSTILLSYQRNLLNMARLYGEQYYRACRTNGKSWICDISFIVTDYYACDNCKKLQLLYSCNQILPLSHHHKNDIYLKKLIRNYTKTSDIKTVTCTANCAPLSKPNSGRIIISCPKVLIIQLDRGIGEHKIIFPVHNLDFRTKKYNLVSVINFAGNYTSGHYYTYSIYNNKWYRFDNNRMVPVYSLITSNARMLFYIRIK
jgi:ubiquitin C-terminal hydrolase